MENSVGKGRRAAPSRGSFARWTRRFAYLAVYLGFTVGVIVPLLWLAGEFTPKVPMDVSARLSQKTTITGQVVPVQAIRVPLVESAVGTIRAVHETSIGSKLLARVVEVHLKAGQKVNQGDVLIRLDDTDLQAKLHQAKAAVTAAEATRAQAALDEQRYERLAEAKAVSRQEYEKASTALRSAEAELRRVQEAVKEVQAMLDWATVRSPIDGIVIDKKVDSGDMVAPGQILVTLFDPKRMQLVASVRESLAHRLQVGQSIEVSIDGLNKQCSGQVSEIVPEAQSASRTFQVKVTGPCPTGIYTGMFGRILIPLEEEQLLVIPKQAVQTVGQLELVEVVENDRTTRRAIRTGRTFDNQVEVLSGLRAGEKVVIPPATNASQEANHG